ncbi:glycosyltransferase family 1 protein [Puniceicoccales bacterium CK1056]|uniref:Glycosyltransferase family 1 protein n=1 Tax=Oceanipulchritudo coccoides TaxID=2706888 RepID=A0A6B2M1M8_9BACT|nr:glycosyltransferase [Oceanipulchritudo coccoides]NDV61640.1 glycosyltransferase family 1 protein [Oceanipulchritudo coccoides]
MAHILCMSTGTSGILNSSLQLVARLQALGHRVTYASPRPVGDIIEAEGVEFLQLPAVTGQTEPPLPEGIKQLGDFRRFLWKVRRKGIRQAEAVDRLGVGSFSGMLDDLSPDVVLAHVELHEFIITSVAKKFNVILFCSWFSIWNRPGLPPIESTIVPGNGFKGSRLGIRLAWARRMMKRWKENQSSAWSSGFTDRRSALRCYAKSIGFPRRLLQNYNWPPPFTYSELPVLSMTAGELDFPHSVRPNFQYIGPMVKTRRAEARVDEGTREKVTRVLEDCRQNGRRLIHLAATSMHAGDVSFLARILQAVGSRPDWVLIGGLGHASTLEELKDIPPNAHVFEMIPQLAVLRQAHCSINHGGINSINECLVFRVPILVYSGGMFDQNGCAARVAYHGIGLRGDKSDSVEAIVQRIEEILTDESIARKLQETASQYEGEEAGKRFSQLMDKLIST